MTFRKDDSHPDGMKMSCMKLYVNALPLMAAAVKKGMMPQEAMLM